MPIWLRNFTYSNIKEYYEKEQEASSKKVDTSNTNKVLQPDIKPTYKSKASTK